MPKPPPRPTPVKHRWLDPWLAATGEPLRRLVERTVALVEHDERSDNARQRRRRPLDEEHHQRRIEVVVANLALAVLDPPESGRLAVNTSQGLRGRTRYDNPALGPKPMRDLMRRLENHQVLEWQFPKATRGEKKSLAPTDWFRRKVAEFGVGLLDIGWQGGEMVVLTRNTHQQGTDWTTRDGTIHRERIGYRDSTETHHFRQQMERINEWLAGADIRFIDDGELPLVNANQRRLRRHFLLLPDQTSPRFDQGGRLFGGFWEPLKKHRRKHIRIDGEPVATLDYSSMFTRLAYATLGVEAPEGDLYAVPGAGGHRSGIKMAMNCLLFDTHQRRGWPKEMGVGVGDDEAARDGEVPAAEFDARLPTGWTVGRTRKAILGHHPVLADAFGRGLGYSLMYQESEVLIAVLEDLMRRGITGLGLHDGLLVPWSRANEALHSMSTIAKEVTGVAIPARLEG